MDNRKLKQMCPECQGVGDVQLAPYCVLCGLPVGEEWEEGATLLPCGHAAGTNLGTIAECPTCEGKGKTWQTVTEGEWQRYQRKRVTKGVALMVLGLLPFLALTIAVLSGDPQMICGNFWYGVGGTILLLR